MYFSYSAFWISLSWKEMKEPLLTVSDMGRDSVKVKHEINSQGLGAGHA